MRKIKPEGMRVGELVYLVGIRHKDTEYILKILAVLPPDIRVKILYLCVGAHSPRKSRLFKLKLDDVFLKGISCGMSDLTMKTFTFYRLNKKEISEFNKLRIIKNLK